MDFAYTPKVEELRLRVRTFMDDHIVPRQRQWRREVHAGLYPVSFMDDLKALARSEGLWNLFLPHLRDDEPGTRLTNLEYAPLAEIMGRVLWASEVFNCNAPDTGNMELLHMFATPAQREQWLDPLLERRDTFRFRDDRAGRVIVRCDEHHHRDSTRGRRVRHQRAQMVHHQCCPPPLPDLHRHGQDRSDRRIASPAKHGAGAAGHARGGDRARHHDHEPPFSGRALRDPVPQRPRAGRATCSGEEGSGFAWPRHVSVLDASTTACAPSEPPNWHWN